MNDMMRLEWDKFLNGHWTKEQPTEEGWYPTADRDGNVASPIYTYLIGEEVWAALDGSCTNRPIPWLGWFWSVPQPYLPLPPIWNEIK